jgi:phage-related protein
MKMRRGHPSPVVTLMLSNGYKMKILNLNIQLKAIFFVVTFSLLTTHTYAHHSFAMFDLEKSIELHGVVKEFQWTNPHTWIQLIVTDENGEKTEWSLEGAPVNMLARRGWKHDSIKPGDEITIVGNALLDGRPGSTYTKITFTDGSVLKAPQPQ